MKCLRCQAENDAGARFCEDCGARLEAACPSCGTPVMPGKKFCRSCGTALTTEPAGRFASPESYTPRHLAEKILTSRAALEGERKQVTVLFADLKGSMELLADRDPEEARKLLDPVLERMMEAVHRYEGTVNQVMGDGIMALFGAPLAHEDHAVRACYAALRMQERREALRGRASPRAGRGGAGPRRRSTPARSSCARSAAICAWTTPPWARPRTWPPAWSSSPHPAHRLTAETLRLVEGFVQVTPLGPVPMKGLGEPVEVFELIGAGAGRTRLEAAARRGLTRFVGRDAELEQLRRALDRASEGRGQVVAMVGEPGVGKSRLVYELAHSHRVHGWLILRERLGLVRQGDRYLAVIELLRATSRSRTATTRARSARRSRESC